MENAEKVSADEISANANLKRLYEQRNAFRKENWKGLAANYEKSVFYQLDLLDAANEFVRFNLGMPDVLKEDAAPMLRIHNRMLRARIMKLHEDKDCAKRGTGSLSTASRRFIGGNERTKEPSHTQRLFRQIVWGRSRAY